uniref:Uncharacterized protein n=1 Tax=Octopus bimaculoides TaxID=37653 RepID=A0A0L8HMY9_OCTBM
MKVTMLLLFAFLCLFTIVNNAYGAEVANSVKFPGAALAHDVPAHVPDTLPSDFVPGAAPR